MSIFTKIGAWFKKAFTTIKDDADVVAITVTEAIKQGLDDGLLPALADVIPGSLPKEIVAELQIWIPKALALELGLQGLPDNASADQITAFVQTIVQAVAGSTAQAKSKLWTTLAAQVYTLIETDVNQSANGNLTFAQIVEIVEAAYVDYVTDEQAQSN